MYEFFRNLFLFYFCIIDLNIPIILVDDSTGPNKRYHCTSYPIIANIYVSSEKSVSNFTSTCEYPPIHLPTSVTPETDHIMIIYVCEY